MGKAVQHPFRLRFFTQILYSQPVVFLIQEKSGFLSILYINQIAERVCPGRDAGLPDGCISGRGKSQFSARP